MTCLGSYTYEKLMNNITYLLVFSIVSDMGCWYYDESTFKIAYLYMNYSKWRHCGLFQ